MPAKHSHFDGRGSQTIKMPKLLISMKNANNKKCKHGTVILMDEAVIQLITQTWHIHFGGQGSQTIEMRKRNSYFDGRGSKPIETRTRHSYLDGRGSKPIEMRTSHSHFDGRGSETMKNVDMTQLF